MARYVHLLVSMIYAVLVCPYPQRVVVGEAYTHDTTVTYLILRALLVAHVVEFHGGVRLHEDTFLI